MQNEDITGPEPEKIPESTTESAELNAPAQTQPDSQDQHNSAPAEQTPEQGSAPTDQSAQPSDQPQPPVQDQPDDNPQDLTALVSYGRLNTLGEFRRPKDTIFSPGAKVIVRTERGIEIGRVVLGYCEGCGDRGVSREKWQRYISKGGREDPSSQKGQILRTASDQDLADQRRLDQDTAQKRQLCEQLIKEMGLDMKLVDVEHLFGGDRILFYFMSEKRVDFRRLVRRLAKEYRTRIEMRQVGARDEARLLADFERCGRECCCRLFLKVLAPVNMRMAKTQKATLDPSKISGRCGRLMCCLRYEHCTYEELRKGLPPRNTLVNTPGGEGIVVDRQILTQLIMVRLPDAKYVAYPLSEITVIPGSNSRKSQQQSHKGSAENSNSGQSADDQLQEGSEDPSTPARRRRKKKRKKPQRPRQ